MGLGIIRIFKAFKGITDKYEGTIKCSKKLGMPIGVPSFFVAKMLSGEEEQKTW